MASGLGRDLGNLRKATQAAPRICPSVSAVAIGTTSVSSLEFFEGVEKEDAVSHHVYGLEALMLENGLLPVRNDGKVNKNESAERLLTSITQDMETRCECTCYANKELGCLLTYGDLVQPDAVVMVDTGILSDDGTTIELPALLVEVHSEDGSPDAQSYEHTRDRLIIGMIDQFRYLTNHCDEASNLQLTGFVFPANDVELGVTEVRLFLSCKSGEDFEFQFKAIEKCLPKDCVKVCIERAIHNILRLKFEDVAGKLCYLRLSTDHIHAIGASAGSDLESLQQVKTPSSILLANGAEYVKVYPLYHSGKLPYMVMINMIAGVSLKQFLMPSRIYRGQIYTFPALPHSSLTREEARQCLAQLVDGVAKALKEIHGNPYYIAHMDVRLENICFDQNGMPILIDPDRAEYSHRPVYQPAYEGVLYSPKRRGWRMFNTDWMQLGYMVAYIIQSNYHDYPQRMEIGEEIHQDPFLMALINEGRHRADLRLVSDVLDGAGHQMDILCVLGQRR